MEASVGDLSYTLLSSPNYTSWYLLTKGGSNEVTSLATTLVSNNFSHQYGYSYLEKNFNTIEGSMYLDDISN